MMAAPTLSQLFSVQRRYARSVNLERDCDCPEALVGYIPTQRAVEAFGRIAAGLSDPDAGCAWTLTGVYGTGKSAFAHFLASLCAPRESLLHQQAAAIASDTGVVGGNSALLDILPERGLFRAIVTGRREPIAHTVVRALANGAAQFWVTGKGKRRPAVARKLIDLEVEVESGRRIEAQLIPELVREVSKAVGTDILLVIDELGKALEYAAYNEGAEDLYLLQQLTELPRARGTTVYVLGLLHQSFSEYGQRLATVQRNEWAKIQGRFEDIPFAESPGQMVRLMGQAIEASGVDSFKDEIERFGRDWHDWLGAIAATEELTPGILEAVYPLHPLTALVLPVLCARYAQNDRSLFTFLTSTEPYSFNNFLDETEVTAGKLPTLKLARVYDYFVEAVGMGLASRPRLSRWVEIQGLIADAKIHDPDSVCVLKTIGVLNLITTTGTLRASQELVTAAMCDAPEEGTLSYWEGVVGQLIQRRTISHFRALNELRLWEGSDFNVDSEVDLLVEQERSSVATLLEALHPLKPAVAQRHSYRTGTLRYFERRYLDNDWDLSQLRANNPNCDGLVVYWVGAQVPENVPKLTIDGKPLLLIQAGGLGVLRMRTLETVALTQLRDTTPQLRTDAVARREVHYRLSQAQQLLGESLSNTFDLSVGDRVCWVLGERQTLTSQKNLNASLSDVCDRVYSRTPTLWNELVNRRELTSQGAKARRMLIEALLANPGKEKLGLEGYGPEVSMYFSLLFETGIHRSNDDGWEIGQPRVDSGIAPLWTAIEEFCESASEKQQSLDGLYQHLAAPPYGIKQGMVPVAIAAVLLYRMDEVGIYKDGTFIPVLGPEHFELLVKDPSRFAVKNFEMAGLRSQIFRELEAILTRPGDRSKGKVRNATLLTVVTPLYQFVKRLPTYTRKTKRISQEARAVLDVLQRTHEPDELLFVGLPQACGLPAIGSNDADDEVTAKSMRVKLVQVLREVHGAYDMLLQESQSLLYAAFGVRSEDAKLREDLRVRAGYLVGQCVEIALNRFTRAATDETAGDREWLQSLLMIVADKPPADWTDEDANRFEIQLSDLTRRFKNLEALQKEVAARGEGFEARRITVTRPDGKETHRMVWVENERQDLIERLVEDVLSRAELQDDPQLQQAFVAKLTERVFGSGERESLMKLPQSQHQREKSNKKRRA